MIRDVVFHFFKTFDVKYNDAIIKRNMAFTKNLRKNYSEEEIIAVIDHIKASGKSIYSMGYICLIIQNTLDEISQQKLQQELKNDIQQKTLELDKQEVVIDNDSKSRNIAKSERFGIQSRFRKKLNFDLFEKP